MKKGRFFSLNRSLIRSELIFWLSVVLTSIILFYYVRRVNQSDFLVFLHAAREISRGRSPYPPVGSPVTYSGSSYVYPYFVAYLLQPLGYFSNYLASMIFVYLSILLNALTIRFSVGAKPLVAVALMVSSPFVIAIQMGTLTPILIFGMVFVWHFRDRLKIVGGFVLAGVAMSKLYLAPLLLFPIWTKRYSLTISSLTSSILLLGIGFVVGPLSPLGFAKMLLLLSGHETLQGWSLTRLMGTLVTSHILRDLSVGAVAGGVIFVGLGIYRKTKDDSILFVALIAASLVLTPILWSSYLPILLVPILIKRRDPLFLVAAGTIGTLLVTPDRGTLAVNGFQFLIEFTSLVLAFRIYINSRVDLLGEAFGKRLFLAVKRLPLRSVVPGVFLILGLVILMVASPVLMPDVLVQIGVFSVFVIAILDSLRGSGFNLSESVKGGFLSSRRRPGLPTG